MLQPAVSAVSFEVGQRVQAVDPDTGKQRTGTVQEVHPATRYARVRFDLKWMHDWLSFDALAAAPIVERLPLGTLVRRYDGTEAVITAHSSCEAQRYQVSWFDRHYMIVRHKWTNSANFEVIGVALAATAAATSA